MEANAPRRYASQSPLDYVREPQAQSSPCVTEVPSHPGADATQVCPRTLARKTGHRVVFFYWLALCFRLIGSSVFTLAPAMLGLLTIRAARTPIYAYLCLGNSFYFYVAGVMAGVLFFQVPLTFGATNCPMFFGALFLGVFCRTFISIVVGT